MSTRETTYYQDSNIMVTNIRAVLGSKTYVMANVTSVSMGQIPANRDGGIVFVMGGLLLPLMCFGCSFIDKFSSDNLLFAIIIGGLCAGLGVFLAYAAKPQYVVRIGSASGESNALISNDRDYIQKIVNAVNEAIIKRG